MSVNEGIRQLWRAGYFATHRESNLIKKELLDTLGLTTSNVGSHLRSCSDVVRKESQGWIQKSRFVDEDKPSVPRKLTLYDVTDDARLIAACEVNFKAGKYWDMALLALRHLEVRTRSKAGLSASDIGADLMEKVFKPTVGILQIPSCATSGEEDGFKQITKGMFMFHRNPKGHREDEIERSRAMKIVGYVDYLIQMVESSAKRNTNSQVKT